MSASSDAGTESVGTSAPTESNASARNTSRDDVFDVLSNHRRRYALHHLMSSDGPVSLGSLAEQIAAWENDISTAELTSAQRKRVYTALQQFHLRKLAATGFIEYDSREGTVSLTEAADSLDVYLDVVAKDDIPWSRYYLGLSGLCLALVAGVWLEIPPFGALSGLAWAAFVALLFTGSSLVHAYRSRRLRLGSDGPPPEFPER